METKQKPGLSYFDIALLWFTLTLWLAIFLFGTLVNSAPYRSRFAALEGGVIEVIKNGLLVVLAYTLTNVAFLCILAGLLGTLGVKAILGTKEHKDSEKDTTSPKNSAILRGFLVYLTLIAGVLIFGENPAEPTQIQYVKLAGLMSLAGFVMNYQPKIFGRLMERAGRLFTNRANESEDQS
ncbi:MAG TPA: hypothetical protein VMW72_02350 [Sedimentisphaerales bacterium]|nr:hypothetical protein [Sedimentisphaerales bacterium]